MMWMVAAICLLYKAKELAHEYNYLQSKLFIANPIPDPTWIVIVPI